MTKMGSKVSLFMLKSSLTSDTYSRKYLFVWISLKLLWCQRFQTFRDRINNNQSEIRLHEINNLLRLDRGRGNFQVEWSLLIPYKNDHLQKTNAGRATFHYKLFLSIWSHKNISLSFVWGGCVDSYPFIMILKPCHAIYHPLDYGHRISVYLRY